MKHLITLLLVAFCVSGYAQTPTAPIFNYNFRSSKKEASTAMASGTATRTTGGATEFKIRYSKKDNAPDTITIGTTTYYVVQVGIGVEASWQDVYGSDARDSEGIERNDNYASIFYYTKNRTRGRSSSNLKEPTQRIEVFYTDQTRVGVREVIVWSGNNYTRYYN